MNHVGSRVLVNRILRYTGYLHPDILMFSQTAEYALRAVRGHRSGEDALPDHRHAAGSIDGDRSLDQLVDELRALAFGGGGDEGRDFFGRGQLTFKIERDAAEKRGVVHGGRGLDSQALEFRVDEPK